jgi:hypothetical protein
MLHLQRKEKGKSMVVNEGLLGGSEKAQFTSGEIMRL